MSLDGSTLEVADEKVNEEGFGRPVASQGDERLSADPHCFSGGERQACAIRQSDGQLPNRRNHPG